MEFGPLYYAIFGLLLVALVAAFFIVRRNQNKD
jgi:LPXTG-motif cell wall-anchored protein